MNIAIIGHGKMGTAIEKIASQKGHTISLIVNNKDFSAEDLSDSDVAIEFTQPSACTSNIKKCFAANIPVVVGTTGWYEHYDEIKEMALSNNQTMLTATNFSLGVNIFFKINEIIAKWTNSLEGYTSKIHEVHHLQKLDSPSGTAITLAETIIKETNSLDDWQLIKNNEIINNKSLPITFSREENVKGIHEVQFENEIDSIQLRHTAKNRIGFASGAVKASEWLVDKKGVFKLDEMIDEIIKISND